MKAMNEMKPISNSRSNMYKFAIILLLAYAAYSSAMRDLDRLQEVAGNVQQVTSGGLGGLAKVYSATRSLAEGPQFARGPETMGRETRATSAFPRTEVVAAGGSVELAGFERGTAARSANHGAAEFSRDQRAHSEASVAEFKTVKYLMREISNTGDKVACDSRKKEQQNYANRNLHLNVLARIPMQVAFVTRDKARRRTIIRKIPVQSDSEQWPGVSEFKALHATMDLGLASAEGDDVETEKLAGEISEASLHLLEKVRRGVASDDTDGSNTHK